MKFEEAGDALANLGDEKLTVGNPKAAQAVCEAGLLMQEGETEDAWMKMKAVDESTSSWLVRVDKEDPLYQPAQNVALWIRASMTEKQFIEDLLEENPQSEEYAEHYKLKAPKMWAEEVLKEDLPSESDDDTYWEVPKIMQVSFKHVEILPDFKQVLGDYERKYHEYYDQLVEDEGEFRAWEEEQNSKLSQPPVYVISGLPLSWDAMPKAWVSTGLPGVGSGDVVELSGRIKKGSATDDYFWLSSGHESTWAQFWVEMASAYKSRISSMPEGSYVRVKAIYDKSEGKGESSYIFQSRSYYFKNAVIIE
jgi:hypothetical protein